MRVFRFLKSCLLKHSDYRSLFLEGWGLGKKARFVVTLGHKTAPLYTLVVITKVAGLRTKFRSVGTAVGLGKA